MDKNKTNKKVVKKEKPQVGGKLYNELLASLKIRDLNGSIVKLIKQPKLTKFEKDSLLSNCRRYMQSKQGHILASYRKFEHLIMNLR